MITESSLLTHLREETHALHEALHVHPLLVPLSEDSITYDDYCWTIKAFHHAYSVSEKAQPLKEAAQFSPVLDWLNADMKRHDIAPLDMLAFSYPSIDTLSKQVGYAYVKQGSTLGGRLISKHLHKKLGLVERTDNRFFAGYGDETGERWKKFLGFLQTSDADAKEAAAQAVQTFNLIRASCDAALTLRAGN